MLPSERGSVVDKRRKAPLVRAMWFYLTHLSAPEFITRSTEEDIKIYIAGFFDTKARLLPMRDEITAMGHQVVSTWLDEMPVITSDYGKWLSYAVRDYEEIAACDLLICDTFDVTDRGGREVELGYALGRQKLAWVVGPKRNVFHYTVRNFETWPKVLKELSTMVGSYASTSSHLGRSNK